MTYNFSCLCTYLTCPSVVPQRWVLSVHAQPRIACRDWDYRPFLGSGDVSIALGVPTLLGHGPVSLAGSETSGPFWVPVLCRSPCVCRPVSGTAPFFLTYPFGSGLVPIAQGPQAFRCSINFTRRLQPRPYTSSIGWSHHRCGSQNTPLSSMSRVALTPLGSQTARVSLRRNSPPPLSPLVLLPRGLPAAISAVSLPSTRTVPALLGSVSSPHSCFCREDSRLPSARSHSPRRGLSRHF